MTSLAEAGERLKAAREAQGLTVAAIAERTRLPAKHIEALEAGDAAALPEAFYVRSFLKKYAEVLGLDPAGFVPTAPAAPAPAAAPAAGGGLGAALEPILPVLTYGAIAALLVGGAYLAWRLQPRVKPVEVSASAAPPASPAPSPLPSSAPSPSASAAPAGAVPPSAGPEPAASTAPGALGGSPAIVGSPAPSAAPISEAVPSPPPAGGSPEPASSPAATGSTTVALEVVQRSWLEVRADGRTLFEGTLPPGSKKSFSGLALRVTAGNAGGVRFSQDGDAWAPLGVQGQVVSRRFTAR